MKNPFSIASLLAKRRAKGLTAADLPDNQGVYSDASWIYGRDNTYQHTEYFDVETRDGKVVAVWFRCQMVPFQQTEVDRQRASDMKSVYDGSPEVPRVVSIELEQ